MKRLLGLMAAGLLATCANAQTDTTHLMAEVTITGFQDSKARTTSLHLEPYSLQELSSRSPYNLSDALAQLPGISQMSTGNAISKPVIRGLYGNRILVLLSGLRFDNQQWQDEHGLGLSQIGIDRVEVIKGPASLLYGTDAIGGVINVIEEQPATQGRFLDINTRLYSNTLGTLTDIGFSSLKKRKWWRLRAGAETHADYSDGDGNRVLNSRNKGYYLKAGLGFTRNKWTQNNAYNFSYNQFGFILPDLSTFFDEDARWTRSMAGPHHIVMLHALSSQNTFALRSSTLKVNAGVQSNRRMEDEGGGAISLDMHLLSLLQNAKWEQHLHRNLLVVINQQLTFENNTNYGKRILIPDANMLEGNLSAFVRWSPGRVNVEAGLGGNIKQITTFRTGSLNLPSKEIKPFSIARPSYNGMLGISYNPADWLNVKSNIATGYRTANLAELSSNGLHEGVYRYEIGDPDMAIEQNLNGDVTIEASRQHLFLSASAYYNHFYNYIYLSPTTEEFFGFPIYRYRQQDANIYGAEGQAIVKPSAALQLSETFTLTKGVLADGGYLPFIPAYRSVTACTYTLAAGKGPLQEAFITPEVVYVFPQDHPARFETATTEYTLVNLHLGCVTPLGRSRLKWNLSARNLLDRKYADHLSRIKDYGLYNQGINFILSVSTNLAI